MQPTTPDRIIVHGLPYDYRQTPTSLGDDGGLDRADEAPPAWPSGWTVPTIFMDCLCTIGPLGFVVFGLVILKTHDKVASSDLKYGEAITVLATLFPIVFAAVLGRFMAQVSRWKLEDGTRLLSLEQLMGSRSVGGTVLTAFQLPINLLTVILLAAWALSPLGAQAILRMHGTRLRQVDTNITLGYHDTRAGSGSETFFGPDYIMFPSVLRTPDAMKAGPLDLWGNVKVPLLSSYANMSIDDWQLVKPHPSMLYSSLLGVPITSIPTGNSTFEIQSTYLELEYESMELDFGPPGHVGSLFNLTEDLLEVAGTLPGEPGNDVSFVPNGTWHGYDYNNFTNDEPRYSTWSLGADTFNSLDEARLYDPNMTKIEASPGRLMMQIKFTSRIKMPFGFLISREFIRAYFKIAQKYVESRVECIDGPKGCRVVAQRPSRRPHPPEALTHLSDQTTFGWISTRLPQKYAGVEVNAQDPAVAYIAGLPLKDSFTYHNANASRDGLIAAPKNEIAARLGQALNTFITIGQLEANQIVGDYYSPRNISTETGASSVLEVVYHVDVLWAALYIVSCVVMLAGGFASVVLCHICVGPEVLGFASSAIRDSRFVNVGPEARLLDGLALTAKARDRRFRFGYTSLYDVDPGTGESRPAIGVGLQEDVRSIKKRKGWGRNKKRNGSRDSP